MDRDMKRYLVCYFGAGNSITFERSFDAWDEAETYMRQRTSWNPAFIIDRGEQTQQS